MKAIDEPNIIRKRMYIALFFTVVMIGLAIAGAYLQYQPIPTRDMWDDYLNFYLQASRGDLAVWFAPHNEHPNTIARLFFWMDLSYFGGLGWFLVVVNYLIAGIGACTFLSYLRSADIHYVKDGWGMVLGGGVAGSMFFWCQWENLAWGYQISMFMGMVFPLLTMYWLYRAAVEEERTFAFVLCCCCGAASVGTMGNAVLTLPLATVASFFILRRRRRTIILFVLTLAGVLAYAFMRSLNHPLVNFSARQNPVLAIPPHVVISYFFSFCGSPFAYIFGLGTVGGYAALVFGIMYLVLCVFLARDAFFRNDPLKITLLGFIVFFLLTAAANTVSRVGLAVSPITSRYTTVAIMGWISLLIGYSPQVLFHFRQKRKVVLSCFCLLAVAMLTSQTTALRSFAKQRHTDRVDTLADILGVNQERAALAAAAIAAKLSIFGQPPFADVASQFGKVVVPETRNIAFGTIGVMDAISDNTHFLKVSGWYFDPQSKSSSTFLRFVDGDNMVVGFAFTGRNDMNATARCGQAAAKSGFDGFILADKADKTIFLQSMDGEPSEFRFR